MNRRLSLSDTGDLKILKNYIEEESSMFSLSEEGDLYSKDIAVENTTDTNLLMSINELGVTVYGSIGKLFETPRVNLINPNGGIRFNENTEILEQTSEYIIVNCIWSGSGITFQSNLNSNTSYRLTVDFEILQAPVGSHVRVGAWNISLNKYMDEFLTDIQSNIGVIQRIIIEFNTGNIIDGNNIEFEFISEADAIRFKMYKADFWLEEIVL